MVLRREFLAGRRIQEFQIRLRGLTGAVLVRREQQPRLAGGTRVDQI